MTRVRVLTVLVLTCVSAAAGADPAGKPDNPTKTGQFKLADMGDFAVKAGGVTFNNFCLREVAFENLPAGARNFHGFGAVTVRGTFRNPSAGQRAYTLVVYGLTAEGEVEWACHLSGLAAPEDVGVFDGQVSVHPGTLKLTPTVRVRARVGPVPDRSPPPATLVRP